MKKFTLAIVGLPVLCAMLSTAYPAHAQQGGGNPQFQQFRTEMEQLRGQEEQLRTQREQLKQQFEGLQQQEMALREKMHQLREQMEMARNERHEQNSGMTNMTTTSGAPVTPTALRH